MKFQFLKSSIKAFKKEVENLTMLLMQSNEVIRSIHTQRDISASPRPHQTPLNAYLNPK